jgi:CheY-like chemotaxis protein
MTGIHVRQPDPEVGERQTTEEQGGTIMPGTDLLEGKRVLVVDDEPDILDVLESLLPTCKVQKANSFEAAKELLESQPFDIAILDIMGVDGYRLLDISKGKGILAVMLTANALSVEDTIRSYKGGAASYLPKEEIGKIEIFLGDVLEAKKQGQHFWSRWLERLGSFYEDKFGADWQEKNKEFWRNFPYGW